MNFEEFKESTPLARYYLFIFRGQCCITCDFMRKNGKCKQPLHVHEVQCPNGGTHAFTDLKRAKCGTDLLDWGKGCTEWKLIKWKK